jgi:hypothetical protein
VPLTRAFAIATRLTPQEAMEAVQTLLIRPNILPARVYTSLEAALDDSGLNDRYQGVAQPYAFEFVRPTSASRMLRPVASGAIHSAPTGSRVVVRIGPTSRNLWILTASSLLAVAAAAFFAAVIPGWPLAWLLGAGGVAGWWLILAIGVHTEARRLQNRLASLLHAGA